MKILVLSNDGGGLLVFRGELMKHFAENNKVIICVPYDNNSDELRNLGCEVIPCINLDRRGTSIKKDIQLFKYYKRIIKEYRPDFALTYTIKPNVYGGLACRLSKTHYFANVTGLGTTIENGGLLSKISLCLYRVGLRKADCVFFQNNNNFRLFMDKKIVLGNTHVIPGSGVNLKKHSFEEYPKNK